MKLLWLPVALSAVAVLAACGGGGGGRSSHRYVIVPTANSAPATGAYLTIISPVAISDAVLTTNGTSVVAHAKGPQVCSYTKPFQGLPGKAAYLNGKTVTLKVNGSTPLASVLCSILKKGQTFTPTSIGA